MALRHREAVQGGDFSQSPSADTRQHPDVGGPMLVTGVEHRRSPGGTWRITLTTGEGKDINLNLGEQEVHGLCHLLTSATRRADWKLNLVLGDPAAVTPTPATRVH
jgi:hypothetical protein